ncbi:MAG: serine/threonine-protein kinase [Ferruginibacter sp.]
MGKVFTITQGLENMGALKTGGQGSVYKAKRMGEIITAVKLLPTPIHSESIDDKNFMDFQNEVEKLKKVNLQPNPHVVKILNSGLTESGNLPFIEMEFIEGPDMEDLLKAPNESIFSIKEIIKVADQLSFALAHCHHVNVKHGDIKSNNVKFNVNTGNYILLDFGLAIMSEEQRRSSMRQVGAIEFMAPEQNEGLMFFQTDVYSFGIILFELLAGTVPFPLKDKSETARNQVMLAHMERTVPDVLEGRRKMLPEKWSDEKREREMQVPQWLLDTIHKCLQKSPRDRFVSGMELHQYIIHHSTMVSGNKDINLLNAEILLKENERLRTVVLKYQEEAKHRDPSGVISHKILSVNEALSQKPVVDAAYVSAVEIAAAKRRKKPLVGALLFFLILACTAGVIYKYKDKLPAVKRHLVNWISKSDPPQKKPKAIPDTVSIGYHVAIPKAYFHTRPLESSRREAYMIQSDEILKPLAETTDFVYIEFTNHNNKLSKGWLKKKDLVSVNEASNSTNNSPSNAINKNVKDGEDLNKIASY